MYGVLASVWCTGWCMGSRLVYGVQAGVWCTGWRMVYRLVYGVQAGVWGLGWCMVYRPVYGQTHHANTSTYLHNTPAHTRHTNLQSRSSLPPCSLCRCQVGTPKEQYRGQSMTDHPVKGTTPSQICMNSSTHVHHDWESNQMHYHLISII